MSPQNSYTCLGRLTRDPETRVVGEYAVTNFGIAVNEKYGKKESVLFIDCEAWGKTGESVARFFVKGSRIHLIGGLKFEQWEGNDGAKRSKIKLNVAAFGFVDSKSDSPAPQLSRQSHEPLAESDIPF